MRIVLMVDLEKRYSFIFFLTILNVFWEEKPCTVNSNGASTLISILMYFANSLASTSPANVAEGFLDESDENLFHRSIHLERMDLDNFVVDDEK